MTTAEGVKAKNIHLQCGLAVDMIIKSSLVRRTFDNVTVVLVAFKNFETIFEEEKGEKLDKKHDLTNHNQFKTIENPYFDNNNTSQRPIKDTYHNEKPKTGNVNTHHSYGSSSTTGKGHISSLSTNNANSLNTYTSNNTNSSLSNNSNLNTISGSSSSYSNINNLNNKHSYQDRQDNNYTNSNSNNTHQYVTNNYLKTDTNTTNSNNLQDKIQVMIDKKPKIRNLSEIIDKNNYFSNNKAIPSTTTNNTSATTGNRYKKSEENVLQYFTKPERKYDIIGVNKPISGNGSGSSGTALSKVHITNSNYDDNVGNTEADYYRANTEVGDYKDLRTNNTSGSLSKVNSIGGGKPVLKSNLIISNPTNTVHKNASLNSKNFNMILGGNIGSLGLSKPSNNSSIKLKTMDIKKKKYDVIDSFESLGSNKKKEEKKNMTEFLSNLNSGSSTSKINSNILKTKENTFENLKKSIPIKSYNFKK